MFQAKGVEVIACLSVNDPFVMSAWGEQHKTEGKIRMLADTTAEFTKVGRASLMVLHAFNGEITILLKFECFLSCFFP